MKVFISWSGKQSQELAKILYTDLRIILNSIEPWLSSENIHAGQRWFVDVSKQLEDINFGIICLTKDNIEAPWIHFEAGALSKTVGASYIVPLLFDIKPTDVKGPLSHFQSVIANKNGFYKLISSLNSTISKAGETGLHEELLSRSFELWWAAIDDKLQKITDQADYPVRSDSDMLEEIVITIRGIQRSIHDFQLTSSVLRDPEKNLSQREKIVLKLIYEGLNFDQIGKELSTSPSKVRLETSSILRKLNLLSTMDIEKWFEGNEYVFDDIESAKL